MNNVQLLLSIGIPSLLVVLTWLSNNTKLAAFERRLDGIDERLDTVDDRFNRVDDRFNEVNSRFNQVIDAQHRDALEIMRALTALHERVAVVETKQATP